MEGMQASRESQLALGLCLKTLTAYSKNNPFQLSIGLALTSIIMVKYRKKVKLFYPFASFGMNLLSQFNAKH
ncbi:MAG TPA: hypothetical protein DEV85_01295 [Vibrio sp.]|nr:hypothetical protein [Vibrio sp.]